MRAAHAGLVLIFALMAGCTSSDDAGPTTTSTTPTETATPEPPPPPPTTDTLHFGAAPDMSPIAPTGASAQQTPIAYRGGMDATDGTSWSYTLRAPVKAGALEAHLFLKVVDTLIVQPAQTPCVWSLTVSAPAYPVGCVNPGGSTINPGTYEVVFTLSSPSGDASLSQGSPVKVRVQRQAFSPSPNDSVFLLSGATDADSRLQIAGLKEPLPDG